MDVFTVVSNRYRGEGFAWPIKNLPHEERWKYGLHGEYSEEAEAQLAAEKLNKAWGIGDVV